MCVAVTNVNRPSLTLNLDRGAVQSRPLGLNLDLGETSSAIAGEEIDIDLPLERQGYVTAVNQCQRAR